MILGKKIVEIRKNNKLTQEDFAEKYNVTRQTISSWENGKSYPDLETLVQISDDFSISLDVLLKEDKKMIKKIAKSQKENKRYKKILIGIIVLVGIFVIINLIWFFSVKIRYIQLANGISKMESFVEDIHYRKIKDGYQYVVKDTGYLGNSGFACISRGEGLVIETDEEGNEISNNGSMISLYLWPEKFNGYTYGIDIETSDYWYQIPIDKDGHYIKNENTNPDEEEKQQKALEENKEEIEKLLQLADEVWNIR